MSTLDAKRLVSSDAVSDAEGRFPFPKLLTSNYFKKYRHGYYKAREYGALNPHRNYFVLLQFLSEIQEYDVQHAKGYARRLLAASKDWRNAEGVFSEIIVYRSYIRAIYEGLLAKIERNEAESDIIVVRPDGSKMFLEVFCVMPDISNFPVVRNLQTHSQTALSSIRQKLIRKIAKQKQFSKNREKYAVIELNDVSIAGDFSILSSLSSGYKVIIDKQAKKVASAGYDWDKSVFDDPRTKYLAGIIYFSLGDYGSRKFIPNPYFREETKPAFSQSVR